MFLIYILICVIWIEISLFSEYIRKFRSLYLKINQQVTSLNKLKLRLIKLYIFIIHKQISNESWAYKLELLVF